MISKFNRITKHFFPMTLYFILISGLALMVLITPHVALQSLGQKNLVKT